MTKRLLVMAGGTGGHVFPGLAVASLLHKQGWQIHWLGTAARMEAQIVPKNGFQISFIDVVGVRGNGLMRKLKAPFQIIKSVLQARQVMNQFKPDVVLGMGGFASGPGGIAAWLKGIPVLLHEQNAIPGLTNRIMARFAKKVLTGFDNTFAAQRDQNKKYQWVGNPVRAGFFNSGSDNPVHSPIRVLVVGGSLGAKALNENVPQALAGFSNFVVRHQCGAGHKVNVTDAYTNNIEDRSMWQVEEFIEDMASAYHWADLLICRAGALTVAETAAAGLAAIYVPLPHAVDDHQTKNAESLSGVQAAYLLPQKALLEGGLVPILKRIFDAPAELLEVSRRARQMAKINATQDVASACIEFAETAS